MSDPSAVDTVAAVVYPNIKAAAARLSTFPRGYDPDIDAAYDLLHAAYWAECPEPSESTFPTQPTE